MNVWSILGFLSIMFIGSTFGWVANILIARLPESIPLTKRPYCISCNKPLRISHLVPVLSFTFYEGECPYCKKEIEPYHLFTEMFAGALAGIIYFMPLFFHQQVGLFIFSLTLWAMCIMDIRYHAVALSLLVTYSIGVILYCIDMGTFDKIVAFIVSGFALTLISFAASIIKNKQMIGLGDIPVMASMIAVLGGHYGIAAIFITFIVAALYLGYQRYKKRFVIAIALMPHLAISFVITATLKYFNALDFMFGNL